LTVPLGFILVCGVIPLCFVAASNFNEFAYEKIKGWFNDL
jgi:hypothetical protein